MSALVEKLRHGESRNLVCRMAGAVLVSVVLLYYCLHSELYAGQDQISLLQSKRTYLIALFSVLLIAFILIPNQLSDTWNRRLSWIWFAAAPFAVYFSLLYLNADKFNIKFYELNKIALVFTFVFLYLLQGFLFCLTGSIRFSVIIYAAVIAVFGIANCFVISFRGMAISAADLFSVNTAMTVASQYTYKLDWYMIMEILFTLAICAVSLKLRGGRMAHPAVRGMILAVCAVVSMGYYHICCKTDFLQEHDIRSEGFSHQLRYKQFDMIFTTLCTAFYLSVDKPDGYSVEQVEKIAEPYLAEKESAKALGNGDTETPHLIVIMNESFADYTDIGNGLSLSDDCMPFIHSLTENTVKGTAYASIFGANTPNSEYEFLTGNTMGFLPESSVGFHLFVRGNMPSVASELKAVGYRTLAIHPYRRANYKRHQVYPQIGFDAYYSREDFVNPEYVRSYISDASVARRIIEEYEKNLETGDTLFCYNVTVQNHGGYNPASASGVDDAVKVLDQGINREKTELYLNLIRSSDEMFRSLVQFFEQKEEHVAILMFGDHQPSLGDDLYEYLLGKPESECTAEELMEKYKVPFVLWTNYDIEEEVIEKTSLNYLYSIVADRLKLPMSAYQEYLLALSEELPALNAHGYWDKEGNFYELLDETSPYYEKIQEYNILEYNDILGGDDRYLSFFS